MLYFKLNELCKEHHLSIKKLSELTNIDMRILYKMQKNEIGRIDIKVINTLCDFFKLKSTANLVVYRYEIDSDTLPYDITHYIREGEKGNIKE